MREQVQVLVLTSIPRHVYLACEILEMEMLALMNSAFDYETMEHPDVTEAEEMAEFCKDYIRVKIKNNV